MSNIPSKEQMIAEITARHGVRLDPDDPAFLVVDLAHMAMSGQYDKVDGLIEAIGTASAKLREGASAFTESARQALSAQLEVKARSTADALTAELRATIGQEVGKAFQEKVTTETSRLTAALRAATADLNRSKQARLVEVVCAALVSAAATAVAVALLMR